MGYTNYWQTKKLTEDQIPATFWDDCEKALDKVIESGVKLADGMGENLFKNGHEIINYTDPAEQYPAIFLNGYNDPEGEDEHYETFCLVFDGNWSFCKTARYPYDLAVKVILMLAQKYDLLSDTSDGDISGGDYWSFDGNETEEEYIRAHDLLLNLSLI